MLTYRLLSGLDVTCSSDKRVEVFIIQNGFYDQNDEFSIVIIASKGIA